MLYCAECVIVFRCPQQSSDLDVSPVANVVVPAVLWREHSAWFVKPHVFVEMTLVVPQCLHLILFVLHDALIAGIGQSFDTPPTASKDGSVIVEIPALHVRSGFGIAVIGEQCLWKVVIVGVEQSHRVSESFRAKSPSEHLVHVEAEDMCAVVTDF